MPTTYDRVADLLDLAESYRNRLPTDTQRERNRALLATIESEINGDAHYAMREAERGYRYPTFPLYVLPSTAVWQARRYRMLRGWLDTYL